MGTLPIRPEEPVVNAAQVSPPDRGKTPPADKRNLSTRLMPLLQSRGFIRACLACLFVIAALSLIFSMTLGLQYASPEARPSPSAVALLSPAPPSPTEAATPGSTPTATPYETVIAATFRAAPTPRPTRRRTPGPTVAPTPSHTPAETAAPTPTQTAAVTDCAHANPWRHIARWANAGPNTANRHGYLGSRQRRLAVGPGDHQHCLCDGRHLGARILVAQRARR